jgi:hypothetical protein
MDERESARAEIDHSRERLKDIASELAHRAKPTYVKQKAKEAAVHKGVELKDRIADSPMALGIISGLATAAIARTVHRRRQHAHEVADQGWRERQQWRAGEEEADIEAEPVETGGRVEALKERIADKVGDVKHAVGKLKDKGMRGVEGARSHIPSTEDVKAKARDITQRGRRFAADEPLITALGALAVGAALGFLLPLSDRERRALGPTREKVGEKLETLASDMTDKVQAKTDELRDKIADEPDRDVTGF